MKKRGAFLYKIFKFQILKLLFFIFLRKIKKKKIIKNFLYFLKTDNGYHLFKIVNNILNFYPLCQVYIFLFLIYCD